jgi:predicted dienelactone hydrolase
MLALFLASLAPSIASIPTWTIDRANEPSRPLNVRVTYPVSGEHLPVIVFSHGLGGSKDAYQPLATYWAEHGFVVVQPSHADAGSLNTLAARSNLIGKTKNWSERPAEIKMVIDALPKLNSTPELKGRMDLSRIGMGGHSFGAHTTELVCGTKVNPFSRVGALEDPRPKCFLMISPQGTGSLFQPGAWAGIARPVLMISGDNDSSPIDGASPQWRKEVWDGFSAGDKYLLWVKDAYHGFGGISGRQRFPGSGQLDPTQVETVQEVTTAYWDAYLKGDSGAKTALQGKTFPGAPATHSLAHK